MSISILLYWFSCPLHWGADGEVQESTGRSYTGLTRLSKIIFLEGPWRSLLLGLKATFQTTDSEVSSPAVAPCEFWLALPLHMVASQALQEPACQSFVLGTLPLPPQGLLTPRVGHWLFWTSENFPPAVYQKPFLCLQTIQCQLWTHLICMSPYPFVTCQEEGRLFYKASGLR